MARSFWQDWSSLQTILFWINLMISISTHMSAASTLHLDVVVTIPFEEPYLFRKELVEPAISLAVHSLEDKRLYGVEQFDFHVNYRNSFCSHKAVLPVVEHYYDQCRDSENIHYCNLSSPLLFLGPICNEPTLVVATFAEHWGVPMMSSGSHVTSVVGGYDHFSTLVSGILPTFTDLAFFIEAIFKAAYSGKRITLIAEDDYSESATERECYNMMMEIDMVLESESYFEIDAHRLVKGEFFAHDFVRNLFHPEVQKATCTKQISSFEAVIVVVLMCVSRDTARDMMLAAWRWGYAIAGSHDWFLIDLHHQAIHETEYPWKKGDNSDSFAKRAFHALKLITFRISTTKKHQTFSRKVDEYYKKAGIKENVNAYVSGFYDAIMLYVHGLNETLQDRENIYDGANVVRHMKNVTFEGISGKVCVDEKGHRFGSYMLLSMSNPQTGKYEKIVESIGHSKEFKGDLKDLQDPKLAEDTWSNIIKTRKKANNDKIQQMINKQNNSHMTTSTMGGAIATGVAIVICCSLIVIRMSCSKKKCWKNCRSRRERSSSNQHTVDSLIPMAEDESNATCISSVEEDMKV